MLLSPLPFVQAHEKVTSCTGLLTEIFAQGAETVSKLSHTFFDNVSKKNDFLGLDSNTNWPCIAFEQFLTVSQAVFQDLKCEVTFCHCRDQVALGKLLGLSRNYAAVAMMVSLPQLDEMLTNAGADAEPRSITALGTFAKIASSIDALRTTATQPLQQGYQASSGTKDFKVELDGPMHSRSWMCSNSHPLRQRKSVQMVL